MLPRHRERSRTLRLSIAALATLAAAPAAAAANAPSYSIAFVRGVPDDRADVFTVDPDGSHLRQVPLVDTAETFSIAVWSPDRRRLLISHVVRFDAGNFLPFRPATINPD